MDKGSYYVDLDELYDLDDGIGAKIDVAKKGRTELKAYKKEGFWKR